MDFFSSTTSENYPRVFVSPSEPLTFYSSSSSSSLDSLPPLRPSRFQRRASTTTMKVRTTTVPSRLTLNCHFGSRSRASERSTATTATVRW